MSRLQASLVLLLAALIWGATFVVQKIATGPEGAEAGTVIGPLAFTGARFLLGACVVLPLALAEARRAGAPELHGAGWAGFVLAGVALFLGSVLQQVGLMGTTVTNAGFFTGLYVPLVPVLALVLFRRRPHWVVWPAAAGCVAGTALLNGGTLDGLNRGDLWVIAGALFWALHVTVVGIFSARTGRPLTLAATQFAVAGLLGAAAGLVVEAPTPALITGAAAEIAWAGGVSVGIAFTLQVIGQRHLHPATAAIILSSEMVFAALAGALAFGERLTAVELAGAAVILACILAVEVIPVLRRRAQANPAQANPAQAE